MGDIKLAFKPYSQEQIKDVIAYRLVDCPYFSSSGMIFASKKLAQYSSDIRIILGVLKEALRQHLEEKRPGQIETHDISKIWHGNNGRG
jgi:Cdc6-like AAA superfamily ATPase